MKTQVLMIGVVIMFSMFLSGCVETSSSWTWDFSASGDGWNDDIIFVQLQIDAVGSDLPEEVFASVIGDVDLIFHYDVDASPQWSSWSYRRHQLGYHQTLNHIIPGELYNVHAIQDCTLTINEN